MTTSSNTHIRIKRSSATATPELLQAGELAYSYVSNTLFLGTAGGDGVLKLGGEAYTTIIEARTAQANANTIVLRDDNGSFSANVIAANNFYGTLASETGVEANTYGSSTQVPVITVAANGLVTNVTTAAISTTMNFSDGTNDETLNLIDGTLDVLGVDGITSTVSANTITIGVDDTILRSNTEGGPQHISTDLQVSGNLTVQGTTTYVQTAINQTDDSMIELAANNTVGDVVDIGFYGKHEGADGTVLTGLVRNAGSSDYYLFDNIGLGDQTDLTSNLITQGSMSANGASLYAKQFLAAEGVGSTGGFSFNNDGGLDTGMFSPADGELNFYSNAVKTFSSNGASFNVSTYAQFDGSVRVTGGQPLWLNNGDNTDNIQINNTGNSGNSRLVFGDNNLETDILGIESNTGNSATQITLYNSTDVRDYVSGESVIVKGEQKYGVVTQFLVNGTDPVTQKEIIDPLVPPAIRDMTPVDLGNQYDDTFVELTTPFDITFNGSLYPAGLGGLYVGSNGYLTFGTGTTNNYHDYPPVATNPGVPAIVVGLGDISYQRVYTNDDGQGHFRVRYEGSNTFAGQHVGGSSSLIWEVVFYRDVPGKFDVRIIRMNGTANDGTDGRWNTYLTDGTNFLDTRTDRTIPWTTYTQFAKQLTNGTNTLELLSDGSIKMTNGTILSDTDSGFFIDSVREDATSSDILYYDAVSKEVTYGTLADLRSDVLSNGSYSWSISGDNGSLTSNVGTSIAASANSVVIGQNVDVTNSNVGRVAIGEYAGQQYQSMHGVAIGSYAGNDSQSISTIAIGEAAGQTNQSFSAVSLGRWAGQTNQGWASVAIGRIAGRTNQGGYSTALGYHAAELYQGSHSVAVGDNAGSSNQSAYAVAVGSTAGYISQGWGAAAFGTNAGYDTQGLAATAIGSNAGRYNQSQGAVAVGRRAGETTQGYYSVAMGNRAGSYQQGEYAIAIGAYAGQNSQNQNSIVFNASGSTLDAGAAGLYINPIRYEETQDSVDDGIMFYNQSTKEVRYSYVLDGGSF